ncbi:MAG: LPS export ABC transporter periplasmic protein LptC [Bacteroidota bacterium]
MENHGTMIYCFDHIQELYNRNSKYLFLPLLFCLALLCGSCENDIEKINALASEEIYPSRIVNDVRIIYTDSAKLEAVLEAKEAYYYEMVEEPYYEFPSGFSVELYDETGELHHHITANYGKALLKEELWEARNDVIVKDLIDNRQLNTEQLFWDQKSDKIYSDKFTKFTDQGDITTGEKGFESNRDFTNWRLIGTRGTVHVEED